MSSKKYRIESACPQCGCSSVNVLSDEEMKDRYGKLPNAELECAECMKHYEAKMKDVCPEWDKDCKLAES